jgi:aspartate aminotransferase
MRDAFKRRRDLVLSLLKDIPGLKFNTPEGAFYVFADVSSYFGKSNGAHKISSGTDLSLYLIDTAHVSMVPGAAFGDDDYLRLSYAISEDKLTEAIKRIKLALSQLN